MADINSETGTVYSREELKAAFERVQNPTNWKMPIVNLEDANRQCDDSGDGRRCD